MPNNQMSNNQMPNNQIPNNPGTSQFALLLAIIAMGVVILASNILVMYPLEFMLGGLNLADWLTYGAFSYPIVFLVTDMANRYGGKAFATKIMLIGFIFGVVLSLVLADPRIALASGTAFLIGQIADIHIFDRLRRASWWKAPLISSFIASAIDSVLFFALAFAGTDVPWANLAAGDFAVKILMALVLLPLYRLLIGAFGLMTPFANSRS